MKSILFASGIDHAEALAKSFRRKGVIAYALHSKNDDAYNDLLLDGFHDGKIQVLSSVTKIAIGFDEPDVECAILCRPTKIRSLYVQMVGRALRLSEGQDQVTILDCAQSTAEHGIYSQDFEPQARLKDAREHRKEMAEPLVDYAMSKDDSDDNIFIVDFKGLRDVESQLDNDDSNDALIAKFEVSIDPRQMLEIATVLDNRWNETNLLSERTIGWILEEVEPYIEEGGSIKAIRTRMKNIVGQGKKLSALRYFPQWLRENASY